MSLAQVEARWNQGDMCRRKRKIDRRVKDDVQYTNQCTGERKYDPEALEKKDIIEMVDAVRLSLLEHKREQEREREVFREHLEVIFAELESRIIKKAMEILKHPEKKYRRRGRGGGGDVNW